MHDQQVVKKSRCPRNPSSNDSYVSIKQLKVWLPYGWLAFQKGWQLFWEHQQWHEHYQQFWEKFQDLSIGDVCLRLGHRKLLEYRRGSST